jgi:hypothetical protein
MGGRGNRGGRGQGNWHQRAAEFHELAAHAHLIAATHHGKEDHQTGHEHSKQAMEYATKAFQFSQEANQKSGILFKEAAKTNASDALKSANGPVKGSKKKP